MPVHRIPILRACSFKMERGFRKPLFDIVNELFTMSRKEISAPTVAQRRWLERGLKQPGGKLPLFDEQGREVPRRTVEILSRRRLGGALDRQSDQAGLAGLPPHHGRPGSRRRCEVTAASVLKIPFVRK